MNARFLRSLPFFVVALALATVTRGGEEHSCVTPPGTIHATQWPDGNGGNNHYYEAVFVPQGLTWDQAKTAAQLRGGYLVSITSSAENDFAFSLVSPDPSFWYFNEFHAGIGPWLGGFQPDGSPEPGGGWSWVSDEDFSFTNWAGGEPSNSGNAENKLHFYSNNGGLIDKLWNDVGPSVVTNGFIVEYESKPSGQSPLVAWWPGDDNALDIWGGTHGILENGASFGQGEVGRAFAFDGVDDFVLVPSSNATDVSSGAGFTVDAWIYPTADDINPIIEWSEETTFFRPVRPNEAAPPAIYGVHFWDNFGCLDGCGARGFLSGALYANIVDQTGASHYIATEEGVVPLNTWSHVALTYQPQTGMAVIYVNGAPVETANLGTFVPRTNLQLNLGARPISDGGCTGNGCFFGGNMDEVEIFNRALSEQEIYSIYQAFESGKCKPVCVTPPDGMVGWWPGDANAKDIWFGHEGTLQGGTTIAPALVDSGFHVTSSSNVTVEDDPALQVSTFTVDFWVRPVSFGENDFNLVSQFTNVQENERVAYGVSVQGGSFFRGHITDQNDNSAEVLSNVPVEADKFQHVALSYDGSDLKIYINGELAGSASTDLSPLASTNSLVIGGGFSGLIDEVEVFKRPLSLIEIKSLYNARSGGKCKPPKIDACYNGHRYVTTSGAKSWTEAEDEAEAMGGYLVAINDSDEQQFLVSTFLSGYYAGSPLWIGLTDAESEGSFEWASGEPLDFTNWNSGEPNNSNGNENYGVFNWHFARGDEVDRGTWNDTPENGTAGYGGNTDGPYFGIIEIPCVTPPENMVSWWPGDGDLKDIKGHHDGTAQGEEPNVIFDEGKVEQGIRTDGDTHIVIGNPADLQLQNLTIDAWIRLDSAVLHGTGPAVVTYGNGGYGFGIAGPSRESPSAGELYFEQVGTGGAGSNARITDTEWHHVAVSKDGSLVKFYIDGELVRTVPEFNLAFTFTTNLIVDNSFPGIVDEVEIFSRALTDGEVRGIYNAGCAGKCKAKVYPPGPVSPYYLTAGAQGTTAVVQLANINLQWQNRHPQQPGEYAIAVTDTVRVMGSYLDGNTTKGAEYSLGGIFTGRELPAPSGGSVFWDGASDGVSNYAVDYNNGGVYRFDGFWRNPVRLFPTLIHYLGITYDQSNNTLWISQWDNSTVEHRELDGSLISSFSVPFTKISCLALDPADGTLWMGSQNTPGIFYRYTQDGTPLQTQSYAGLEALNTLGGEFQATPSGSPTPTPSPTPVQNPAQVSGSGAIARGESHPSFSFSVGKNKKKKVTGSFSYNDPAAALSISANKLSSLSFNGSSAHFSGSVKNGRHNKLTFTVDVTDNGTPGTLDTFSISVSNGYSASGNLTSGDIQVR